LSREGGDHGGERCLPPSDRTAWNEKREGPKDERPEPADQSTRKEREDLDRPKNHGGGGGGGGGSSEKVEGKQVSFPKLKEIER
jgi:hypothetical protein